MVNNQIPGNTVDAEGNRIPPIQTDAPEAVAPATLAELRSMIAQLQQKVNDQEQTNRSLAQQLEVATSPGQIRTTRFGARHLQDRRAAADLNPTRLVFHTPGNTTRPVRRTAREIGRDRTEPIILGNWETNRNEPQLPPPRAEVTEADHIDVSDNKDSEENIRWAEEYAREISPRRDIRSP